MARDAVKKSFRVAPLLDWIYVWDVERLELCKNRDAMARLARDVLMRSARVFSYSRRRRRCVEDSLETRGKFEDGVSELRSAISEIAIL